MDEHLDPITNDSTGSSGRRAIAGGLVAALALLGIGGAAVAQDRDAQPEAAAVIAVEAADTIPEAAPATPTDGDAERDYDDPFAGMTDEEIDALTDEEFFDLLDNAGIDTDTDWDDTEDTTHDDWDDTNDPFAGMTDEEIDALTDEEFFDLLDNAGIDTDTDWDDTEDTTHDDWDDTNDPFAGMTDEEIDALTDEEFFDLLDNAGIDTDDVSDDAGDHDHGDEAAEASFPVNGDQLDTSGVDPATAAAAQAIWNRFIELIPADQRTMLTGFELLGADAGGHVYPDTDPTKWIMGIGQDLGDELDYVLIHEFAHLLTLQANEVPPGDDDGSCPTYHTGEGCALRGSTFAAFVANFWPQEMLDEVFRAQDAGDYDAMDAFYQKYQDRFVTDYATTNPAEDLAETFTHFVLNDRRSGTTIADQKVQFLWNDPDMVQLRDQIRSAL